MVVQTTISEGYSEQGAIDDAMLQGKWDDDLFDVRAEETTRC